MRAQHGRVMTRAQRKAFVDDDGRDIGIEHRGAEGVFEAADDDRLIDERIDRTPQLAPFGRERRPVGGREAGDDQGFEIGTARRLLAECRRHQVGSIAIAVILHTPVAGVLAERPRRQGLRDPGRKRKRRWPHRRPQRLPSTPPSIAGRDSRETLPSPRDRPAPHHISRDPRLAPTPLPPSTRSRQSSARPPGPEKN